MELDVAGGFEDEGGAGGHHGRPHGRPRRRISVALCGGPAVPFQFNMTTFLSYSGATHAMVAPPPGAPVAPIGELRRTHCAFIIYILARNLPVPYVKLIQFH